jgi:hypothetical protein
MNDQTPVDKIVEQNRAAMEMIPVGKHGVAYENFLMIADRARSLSRSKFDVPAFLKGNEWDCVNVVEKAVGWGFQPSMVAPLLYEVNGRVGYMSQLLHALLIKSNILLEPIDYRYEGEGDERICIIIGIFKAAPKKPREYRSPPYGKISPKNSPLWKTDPDQQAGYLGLARWVRRHCPHIFLGCYTVEELQDSPPEHFGPDSAKDVTEASAALHKRLAEAAKSVGEESEGFRPDTVDLALAVQDAPQDAPQSPKEARRRPGRPKGSGTKGKKQKALPL